MLAFGDVPWASGTAEGSWAATVVSDLARTDPIFKRLWDAMYEYGQGSIWTFISFSRIYRTALEQLRTARDYLKEFVKSYGATESDLPDKVYDTAHMAVFTGFREGTCKTLDGARWLMNRATARVADLHLFPPLNIDGELNLLPTDVEALATAALKGAVYALTLAGALLAVFGATVTGLMWIPFCLYILSCAVLSMAKTQKSIERQ